MKRIVLSAEDFKTLVGGGIVEQDGVKIILSDIGYHVMIDSIVQKRLSQPTKVIHN